MQLTLRELIDHRVPSQSSRAEDWDFWVQQRFASIQHQEYSLWLDSAAFDHPNSRYHILLKQPEYVLTARGQATTLTRTSEQSPLELSCSADNFISAASQIHDQLGRQIQLDGDADRLPFCGGLAGLMGYDLGRQLERLPDVNPDEYETNDAVFGIYLNALIIDKLEKRVFLLAPTNTFNERQSQWLEQSACSTEPFKLTSEWQSNMSADDYLSRFNAVKNYLAAGDCYQINLAQRFSAHYQGAEWLAYLKLRASNRAPFSAFMRLPTSCLLSVSPERFISVSAQGQVETKPIKGTRPRSHLAEQDEANRLALINAEKDRAENLMIVDLLRNDLSKHCQPHSVDVPKLFAVESFPAVHHLVSTVVGQLNPHSDTFHLWGGAFPGGSITGAPKVRAMEIIEELEPNRRNAYCGSIGFVSVNGNSDSSITIRTLVAERGIIYCWAGGGLVYDSKGEEEYQETFDKVARILPTLETTDD